MDSITILIKNEISRQYKSVRHFSEISGIPYSTISNALARGTVGYALLFFFGYGDGLRIISAKMRTVHCIHSVDMQN